MSGQCIVAGKCLLLGAKMTSDLEFAGVVDSIFVSGEVVGP